jgi:hypothetical protein
MTVMTEQARAPARAGLKSKHAGGKPWKYEIRFARMLDHARPYGTMAAAHPIND